MSRGVPSLFVALKALTENPRKETHSVKTSSRPKDALTSRDWYALPIGTPVRLQEVFDGKCASPYTFVANGSWEIFDAGSPIQIALASDWSNAPSFNLITDSRPRTHVNGRFEYALGMLQEAKGGQWTRWALQVCDGGYMSSNCTNAYTRLAPPTRRQRGKTTDRK